MCYCNNTAQFFEHVQTENGEDIARHMLIIPGDKITLKRTHQLHAKCWELQGRGFCLSMTFKDGNLELVGNCGAKSFIKNSLNNSPNNPRHYC